MQAEELLQLRPAGGAEAVQVREEAGAPVRLLHHHRRVHHEPHRRVHRRLAIPV